MVNSIQKSELQAEIKLLISNNPNSKVLSKSSKLNIPFLLLNHRNYSSRRIYDKEIVSIFSKLNIEGIVMAGWMRIVTSVLIDAYPNRIINIHPSLLPSFRGVNAIDQALKAGVLISGCSVHIVKDEVDSGPLLIQAAVPIYRSDDKETLTKRIQKQEHRILPIGVAIAGNMWRNTTFYG